VHERTHVAFVIFVRAVNIEEFQAANFVQETGALGVQVKPMLRVAIHIQWPERIQLRLVIFHALLAIAVGRSG
jgi:transcriptional regulator of nitric oxide reductase